MTSAHEAPMENKAVYEILDDIRREVGLVRTDVAVLASAQPRIMDIVEDHERRIRVVETIVTGFAAVIARSDALQTAHDLLEGRVSNIQSTIDKDSWLPRLGWSVVIALVGIGAGLLGSQLVIGG